MLEGLAKSVKGGAIYGKSGWLDDRSGFKSDDVLLGIGIELFLDVLPLKNSTKPNEKPVVSLELGLGYESTTRFKPKDESLDMHGTLRSAPTIALYVAWNARNPIQLYGGISSGFDDLTNANLVDSGGRQYTMKSGTFEIGGCTGLYVGADALGGFIEFGYNYRYFSSIEYGLPSGATALPANAPRTIDLSAKYLSVGIEFTLDTGKDTTTKPKS